jgi:hypothetical protein
MSFICRVIDELAPQGEPIPLGFLVVLLHAATGIESKSDILQPKDREEARNYRVYSELARMGDSKFVNAAISGAFKPPGFIHPFEKHYSLPGYLDPLVLSMFFSAADSWAHAGVPQEYGSGFLSFIYMFFLLVHPFIDRNGRVARGVLDYYNKTLKLNLTSWHTDVFKKGNTHKEAFRIFFEEEVNLPPRKRDPYPITDDLRPHLGCMADYMLDWAAKVASADKMAKSNPFEIHKSTHWRHVSCLKRAFQVSQS